MFQFLSRTIEVNNGPSPKPVVDVKNLPQKGKFSLDAMGLNNISGNASVSSYNPFSANQTHANPDGIMASGKKAYVGAVATNDRDIPLGTKVNIGGKTYVVEDHMNPRFNYGSGTDPLAKTRMFDLVNLKGTSKQFGRQDLAYSTSYKPKFDSINTENPQNNVSGGSAPFTFSDNTLGEIGRPLTSFLQYESKSPLGKTITGIDQSIKDKSFKPLVAAGKSIAGDVSNSLEERLNVFKSAGEAMKKQKRGEALTEGDKLALKQADEQSLNDVLGILGPEGVEQEALQSLEKELRVTKLGIKPNEKEGQLTQELFQKEQTQQGGKLKTLLGEKASPGLDRGGSLTTSIAETPNVVKPPTVRGGLTPPELNFNEFVDRPTFSLSRETLDRNIDLVAGKQAPEFKSFLVEPIKTNETARINFLNGLREMTREQIISELGIRAGSAEDALIQRFGEGRITTAELGKLTSKSQAVQKASTFFRTQYDTLLDLVNGVRKQFGYEGIPKRADYFRHFQEINDVISQFGLIFKKEDLPTEIAGITDIFKPGKPFSTAELQRKGGKFTESAIRGFDNYLDSISKQIFHLDSVQRGRAMEKYIRQAAEQGQAKLPNFVSNLSEFTNLLSGKKAKFDRAFESILGRPFLSAMNALRSRTAANMVGANLSSALTNFIPFTQSLATTSKPAFIRGLFESLIAPFEKEFARVGEETSSFLIRRFPDKIIDPTGFQKASQVASWLFESVDKFAAKSIVSAKYFEQIGKGLSPTQAIKFADEYAGKVMADRSIGQLPNLMNTRTLGVFTQFQTEINNMYSFIRRDIPKLSNGNKAKIISSMAQFFIYSYLFNQVFQQITGRKPTLDPINAVLTIAGKNTQGEGKPLGKRIGLASTDLAQNLPFTGILAGGGRLPISAGLPNIPALLQGQTTVSKELKKPLFFLAPPIGGLQLKKSLEGIAAYTKGREATAAGKTKYLIHKTRSNLIRGGLFGKYAFPEATKYYNKK